MSVYWSICCHVNQVFLLIVYLYEAFSLLSIVFCDQEVLTNTKNQDDPDMHVLKSDCRSHNTDNILLHFFSGECLLQMAELPQYAV